MDVLVADDDAFQLNVIKTLLKSVGINATGVGDGTKAVDEAKKNGAKYKAMLLDFNMPKMGGKDACKEIRKFNTAIKIFALSADADKVSKEDVAKAGFNGALMKPITKATLIKWKDSL